MLKFLKKGKNIMKSPSATPVSGAEEHKLNDKLNNNFIVISEELGGGVVSSLDSPHPPYLHF